MQVSPHLQPWGIPHSLWHPFWVSLFIVSNLYPERLLASSWLVAAGGCSQTPHWLIDVLLVTHKVDDTHCSEDVTPLFRFLVLIILMVNTCSLIVNSHLMFFPDDGVCTLDLQLSLINLLYYSPKGVAAPLILTSSKSENGCTKQQQAWEWEI